MANNSHSEYEIYHVPEKSRLAICASIGLFVSIFGAASFLNDRHPTWGQAGVETNSATILLLGLSLFILTLFAWFKTTISENLRGMNSAQLKHSYVLGMQWFIFSEVMFFFAFFGALWYVRNLAGPWLAGEGAGGRMNSLLWPGFEYTWPMVSTPQETVGLASQMIANNGVFRSAIEKMHWNGIPLINTVLLLSSSVTLHFAHHALKAEHRKKFNVLLAATLLLGFAFVAFQAIEYHEAYTKIGLTLNAGIYGSTFFMLTGFHGFHVCMGALMLSVQWLRSIKAEHFTKTDHFGFEASAWYWHFVDVVWLALFLFVYIL